MLSQRPEEQGGTMLYVFLKDPYAQQQIKVSVNLQRQQQKVIILKYT